jgi:hypothetical protein
LQDQLPVTFIAVTDDPEIVSEIRPPPRILPL